MFEKISDSPAGEKVDFYKVDVDTQDKIASEVGIKAMPTFVAFHKGQAIEKVVGANPAALQVCSNSPPTRPFTMLLVVNCESDAD